MSAISKGITILVISMFLLSNITQAADSTGVKRFDSTGLRPATNVTPLRPYTETQALPPDLSDFSDPKKYYGLLDDQKKCKPEETRPNCVVRYEVVETWDADHRSIFHLTNSNLQCPGGYFITAAFGNQLFNVTKKEADIYYFEGKEMFPVPYDQYTEIKNLPGLVCNAVPGTPIVDEAHHCIQKPPCSDPAPEYKNVDGYLAKRVVSTRSIRDTFSKSDNICKMNPLGSMFGCSSATDCAKWPWEHYKFANAKCTIPGGFYRSATGEGASSRYVPSIIICSKPQIKYKKAESP